MSIYRFSFGKNFSKLINLKNVSSIQQHENKLTIKYNFNSKDSFLVFGSGVITEEPHTEVIHCDNEQEASNHIIFIQNSFNYQKIN